MRSPYFFTEQNFVVSSGIIQTVALALRDKAILSREDRFILENHTQDILRILIKQIVSIDGARPLSVEEKSKIRRLLEEYLETNELLAVD